MAFQLATLAHLSAPATPAAPSGPLVNRNTQFGMLRADVRAQINALPDTDPNKIKIFNAPYFYKGKTGTSLEIGPFKIPEKVGLAALAVVTAGASGAFSGAAAAGETGAETVADNYVGDFETTYDSTVADNYVGDIPTTDDVPNPTTPPPPGTTTLASKILDYAIAKNLSRQQTLGPGEADVSPTSSAAWKNPHARDSTAAGSSIGAASSTTWYVVLAVAAILLVFFLKGR